MSDVNGPLTGHMSSNNHTYADRATLAYMVLKPQFFPRNISPNISSATFKTNIIVATFIPGTMALSMIAIPLTPPIAKLKGVLKKFNPAANIMSPRFKVRKFFHFCSIAHAP